MAETSEARKRREAALFDEPQWRPDAPVAACCERHERVLRAVRTVWGDADLMEAVALTVALEDESLL